MAVKIRLKQIGKRDQRGYRVVVVDERKKRDGEVLETIGHVVPGTKPAQVTLKKDRLDHWRQVGAQLSDGVRNLLAHKPE